MLGERIEDPDPFVARPGFLGVAVDPRDPVGWRAVGYLAVKVPWTVLGFFCGLQPGGTYCLRPALPVRRFGRRPRSFRVAAQSLSPPAISDEGGGFPHAVVLLVCGAIFLLAAPWAMRAFVNVDGMLIRGLLGPDPMAARVHSLEQARSKTVDASAATLRRIERDLHDGTQAQLVALAMRLGMAKEKLGDVDHMDLDQVRELVDEAHRGAKDAIAELRDIARGSTRRPWTSVWKVPWPRWPHAVPSPPRCR